MKNSIRWTKSDYLTLGRAVSNFNRKIKELQTEENKLYLPEPLEYGEIKKEILTRGKLNDVLRSLRSFNEVSAQPILNRQTQQLMTKWEAKENQIKEFRATKLLIKQGKEIQRGFNRSKTKWKKNKFKTTTRIKIAIFRNC